MILFILSAFGIYLLSAIGGSRTAYFEELCTSFRLANNGSWELSKVERSNGDVPEQFKKKVQGGTKK